MRDRLIELFKKIEYTPFPGMATKANLANQFTDYAINCIVDEMLKNGVIVTSWADIQEVVYCEECKYLEFGECVVHRIPAGGTQYCSYGERR